MNYTNNAQFNLKTIEPNNGIGKDLIKNDISSTKWNNWLNAGGLALGGYNTIMNHKQFKLEKGLINKQKERLNEQINDLRTERANRNKFRKEVSRL